MSFKVTLTKTQELFIHNCGVRINTGMTLLVPTIAELFARFPQFREFLPPEYYAYGFMGLALLNIILHTMSHQPVVDKAGGEDGGVPKT